MKIKEFFYSFYIRISEAVTALYSSLIKRIFSIFKATISESAGATQKNGMSQSERDIAFQKAAANGYLATIRTLLASGPVSGFAKEAALIEAVRKGHLAIIKDLLSGGGISKIKRDDALLIIMQQYKGSLELLEPFLNIKPKDLDPAVWASLLKDTRKHLLLMALSEPLYNKQVVKTVLSADDIDQEILIYAFKMAIYQKVKDEELIKSWIVNDKSGEILYEVIVQEKLLGDDSLFFTDLCLKELRQRFNKPEDSERLLLIEVAVKTGFFNKELKQLIRKEPISDEMRGCFISYISTKNSPELLKYFLSCGPIPLEVRKEALKGAIQQGRTLNVQALLQNNQFFDPQKDTKENFYIEIMKVAARSGNFDILSLLMVSPKILFETLVWVLEDYTNRSVIPYRIIFKTLIGSFFKVAHLFSSKDGVRLAQLLIDKRQFKVLQKLLESGLISPEHRGGLVKCLTTYDFLESPYKSLKIVLESGPILDRDLKECIKYAETQLERATTDLEKQTLKSIIEIFEKCSFTIERAMLVKSHKIASGDDSKIRRSDLLEVMHTGFSKQTSALLGIVEE